MADSAHGGQLGFGVVVGGTNNDGYHVFSGINNFYDGDCASRNCTREEGPRTKVFGIGAGSSAQLLEDPLWYAAKFGGLKI